MTLGDFSQQAESYRKSRPTYPAILVDQLIIEADVHPGDPVADFGAGTGIFTELLLDHGFSVTAIEPNDSMRSRADVSSACWISGSFEESHLQTASHRWAVAAQAFHWADPRRALPELHRILQPDCFFTLIWNDRAKIENSIVHWTEDAIRRRVPEFDEAYRARSWNEVLESTGHFQFIKHRIVRHSVFMSRDRYLELWKSHNRLNTIAGPERFQLFFRELVQYLEHEQCDEIEVQYDCNSWSARRIG